MLLLLFVGSGCAALIYEIVWFQLLQLVIGSSAVSLAILLGAFMGGMCLGSIVVPRRLDRRRHPLQLYAALEFGIGAVGLLLLWGMPLLTSIYAAIGGGHVVVRGVVAGLCLLPPAVMMGATLPVVARWVETSPAGVSWLGFFYGGNIVGAVFGCLFAGFYLLRVHDMAVATYVAVAINVLVALVALRVAQRTTYVPAQSVTRTAGSTIPGSTVVYVAVALSGLTALASEVLWTRLLSLLFGATVYAFSLILAVFLLGLGVGSGLGAALARGQPSTSMLAGPHPRSSALSGSAASLRAALGWCQLLLSAAIAWAAHLLTESLPYWPINPTLASNSWVHAELDLFRCLLVVLPGAILWGASFPLALAAVAAPGQDASRLVGGVYAANTIGAVGGALGMNLLVVSFGSQHAQQALVVLSAVSAFLLLAPSVKGEPAALGARWVAAASLIVAAGGVVLLARSVSAVPGVLVAYGRYSAPWVGLTDVVFVGEGMNASIAVSRASNGVLTYHNAGKVQASTLPEDMRLQRMLGHFSHLIPAQPKHVLVIGFGAGVTAGAVAIAPGVERMTIAEIEPLVPRSVSAYFEDFNYRVLASPKVIVHLDDARHFLLTTSQKFDVITSDMVDPWVKGTAALFTREFFEIVKGHLNPGGVVTLFVQLYQSSLEAVKSELGTFIEVFPNTVVWGNTNNGQGYDLVLTAQSEPIKIDIDTLQAKLGSPPYGQVAESLREIGIGSAVDLVSTYAGSAADLAPWLEDAVINRDRNLRLQYLAGLGLNLAESGPIYAEILQYARFPAQVLTGSPASVQAARDAIERAIRR